MENNLVQQVKSYFTAEIISSLSTHLGEDTEKVTRGIDVAIPTLLLGFQSHVENGLNSILNQSRHLFSKFQVGQIFGNYFGSHQGTDDTRFESDNLLATILGDKLPGVLTAISGLIGIETESVRSLLGAMLPATISTITRKGGSWEARDVRQRLSSHKNEIAAALPVGMGLGIFGSSFAQAEAPVEIDLPRVESNNPQLTPDPSITPDPPIVHTEQAVKSLRRNAGLWWILVPLLLLLLWVFFGKSCNTAKGEMGGNNTVSASLEMLWRR